MGFGNGPCPPDDLYFLLFCQNYSFSIGCAVSFQQRPFLLQFAAPNLQSLDYGEAPEESENKIEPAGADVQSIDDSNMKNMFTKDEYHLATLGYKQEFFRGLGLFENW